MTLRISDFDYDLPEELIAQEPLSERDASRMLVLNRSTRTRQDSTFREFTEQLRADDLVIVNNSRVIPARLIGRRKESGGRVEIFLVREISAHIWQVLIRPSARLRAGAKVIFSNGELEAELIDEPGAELRKARFVCDEPFDQYWANRIDTVTALHRATRGSFLTDNERYQTIWSKPRGAIAANCRLHFTGEQLSSEETNSWKLPFMLAWNVRARVDDVNEHEVSSERRYFLPATNQSDKGARRRIIAVGTKCNRALESASNDSGQCNPIQ